MIIRHYDVTCRMCPKYYVEHIDAWKKLKQDVSNTMNKDEEFERAVKVLQQRKIISRPEVWTKGGSKDNVRSVIIKVSSRI